RAGRLPHGLLVHGAQGVGKLALAEKIAQFLLCEAKDAARKPCGACEGCRWYAGGNHPDFRRLEPEALAPQPDAAAQEEEEGEAPARRGVALPVAIPPKESALRWLSAQGVPDAERWLAYAGGAPLRALDYAGKAVIIERMLRAPAAVEDRDELELLAEALQKSALDRA